MVQYYLHVGAALFLTSGTARALVRGGAFTDTALGAFGTAHRAAGAAAWKGRKRKRSEQASKSLLPRRPG